MAAAAAAAEKASFGHPTDRETESSVPRKTLPPTDTPRPTVA